VYILNAVEHLNKPKEIYELFLFLFKIAFYSYFQKKHLGLPVQFGIQTGVLLREEIKKAHNKVYCNSGLGVYSNRYCA